MRDVLPLLCNYLSKQKEAQQVKLTKLSFLPKDSPAEFPPEADMPWA